jgi:RNA polymerase sigma factor for flagellar operon FliA
LSEIDWSKVKTDRKLYEKVLVTYQPLVKKTALSLHKNLPQHVDIEDLISDGIFGLMDAIEKFDASYGYKFETYASLRIRGEILDKLRTADWAPRSLRSKNREITKATESLSRDLGREPSYDEIAQLLGWDSDEVSKTIGESNSSIVTNIDNIVNVDGYQYSLSEIIPDQKSEIDNTTLNYDYIADKLSSAIENLTDQQKIVIILYYKYGISLKKIGEIFEFTESRACQVHTAALGSLWDECLA